MTAAIGARARRTGSAGLEAAAATEAFLFREFIAIERGGGGIGRRKGREKRWREGERENREGLKPPHEREKKKRKRLGNASSLSLSLSRQSDNGL